MGCKIGNYNIEPKFSLKEKVWYMRDNRVCTGNIVGVNLDITTGSYRITYWLDSEDDFMREIMLYASKEELIKSL